MMCSRRLWRAFIRFLIAFLAVVTVGVITLALVPGALQELILVLSGNAEIPAFGEIPGAPVIHGSQGQLPQGVVTFLGVTDSGSMACGFLLELEDGRRAGFSAAHATPLVHSGGFAEFQSPDGNLHIGLDRQLRYGRPFYREHFTMDYVVWSVAENVSPELFLKPDERGQAQPGERVLVYSQTQDETGGSQSWPGTVMTVEPEATWIQLEASFDPLGFSGCPVVSAYTGRVVGMAVAGTNRPPVVMGLHPVGSLVEKALDAFDSAPSGSK